MPVLFQHPKPAVADALARTVEPFFKGEDMADVSVTISLPFADRPVTLADLVRHVQQCLARVRLPPVVTFADATLDTATRVFTCAHHTVELTEKEVALLVYIAQQDMAVTRGVTRAALLRDVWRYAADAETHTIETHIHRLRQKIEPDPDAPRYLITTKDGYCLG